MSGQRNKKPDDIIKNRQEYLDNLNQEIALQDANEQAVRTYKETGQMPVSTQMKDNRTVEDKLRDFEKLKASIREDLAPIATTSLANSIIQKVQNSPFNQDNGLLIFFAQRAPDLVKNLQKSYKFGIKGDENDAVQFVNFIEKFYNDKNNLTSNAKQFMTRLGSNTQVGLSKKANQQSEQLNRLETEINRNIVELTNLGLPLPLFTPFLNELELFRLGFTRLIDLIKYIYPFDLIYKNIGQQDVSLQQIEEEYNKMMLDVAFTPAQNALQDDYDDFFSYINNNIPNTDYIFTLLTTLRRQIEIFKTNQTIINSRKVIDAFENINKEINTGETPQFIQNVKAALNRILAAIRNRLNLPAAPPVRPAVPAFAPIQAADAANVAGNAAQFAARLAFITVPPGFGGFPAFAPYIVQPFYNNLVARAFQLNAKLTQGYIDATTALKELDDMCSEEVGLRPSSHGFGLSQTKIKGSGFPLPAYNFTKQYVEPTQGVQEDPRYIKFGRYLVNTKSLKDNKLSLRRPKGGVIASLPVYKMSNPFSKVIKKIVGGALPTQDDFSDLTEEELRYLHKVSKESDLSHKIEIPTPTKDEDEKDAHLFNVYKGEIMAGNDNKEMIRKFKLLLIKLSKNNTINKKEANEILEMLTHAGY